MLIHLKLFHQPKSVEVVGNDLFDLLVLLSTYEGDTKIYVDLILLLVMLFVGLNQYYEHLEYVYCKAFDLKYVIYYKTKTRGLCARLPSGSILLR